MTAFQKMRESTARRRGSAIVAGGCEGGDVQMVAECDKMAEGEGRFVTAPDWLIAWLD